MGNTVIVVEHDEDTIMAADLNNKTAQSAMKLFDTNRFYDNLPFTKSTEKPFEEGSAGIACLRKYEFRILYRNHISDTLNILACMRGRCMLNFVTKPFHKNQISGGQHGVIEDNVAVNEDINWNFCFSPAILIANAFQARQWQFGGKAQKAANNKLQCDQDEWTTVKIVSSTTEHDRH
ncbi:hypothetical protein DINM_005645 [Dirofilaria immitis]|nr:hypothetical protein [Dirofilaria immitis]